MYTETEMKSYRNGIIIIILTRNESVRSTTSSSSRPLSFVRSTMEASEGVLERELTEMGRRVRLSDADTTINSSSLFSVRDGLNKYQSNLLHVLAPEGAKGQWKTTYVSS